MTKTIITGASQIVTFDPNNMEMSVLESTEIAIENGKISAVGKNLYSPEFRRIDAKGKVITPGLIDPHTHPVFAQTREKEFELRAQGKTYLEIAKAGGGIKNSVKRFRETPTERLISLTRFRLKKFLTYGTTTIEAKSGYGLSFRDEIRSLEILRDLGKELPLTIIPTFLGAHEIPEEYSDNRTAYIDLLENEMIPYVVEHELAEFCDVFCDEGVYTPDETARIFKAARKHGLKLRLHTDEFKSLGGVKVAVDFKAASVDHLSAISEKDIEYLVNSNTTPILLPGTTFFLGSNKYAPARKMFDMGMKPALATDYNPGSSHTQSLQFIMTIACTQMKLTPLEVLQSTTYNAALSLGRESQIGAVAPKYEADLAIWEYPDYRCIPYYLADNGISVTIKKGKIIWEKPEQQERFS